MKTSIIILVLLAFNTTAILAEPIAQFIGGIHTWVLILVEALLAIVYWVNNILKDVNKAFNIELNDIDFYPVTKPKE